MPMLTSDNTAAPDTPPLTRRGLPVTKRRVEYIQEKISGGGGGGTGGGHKNDRSYAKERDGAKHGAPKTPAGNDGTPSSSRSLPAVKKVSRGAIHAGGGPAQGKAGAVDRQAKVGEEEEEEEAGADFLAELRERFAVDTEELASDTDLDLLADDALFAAPSSPADGTLSGLEEEEEEGEGEGEKGVATAAPEGIEELIGGSTASGGVEGDDGRVAEQGEEVFDSRMLPRLEEIKAMKV